MIAIGKSRYADQQHQGHCRLHILYRTSHPTYTIVLWRHKSWVQDRDSHQCPLVIGSMGRNKICEQERWIKFGNGAVNAGLSSCTIEPSLRVCAVDPVVCKMLLSSYAPQKSLVVSSYGHFCMSSIFAVLRQEHVKLSFCSY